MITSQSLKAIAPALLAAQKEMGNATKDKVNPFFKSTYATLNSVREAVTPALHKYGITVLQPTVAAANGKSYVRTTLLHESGDYICSDTEIVWKDQTNAQQYGSAISYARRFGLAALLSVGVGDEDGNDLVEEPKKSETKTSNGAGAKPFGSFRKTQNV